MSPSLRDQLPSTVTDVATGGAMASVRVAVGGVTTGGPVRIELKGHWAGRLPRPRPHRSVPVRLRDRGRNFPDA
ncbi:hypothetical protein ACIOEX_09620 [Streptomyces sp. NPDC087850]|uniref:hypothetical protein n=1 Tax=Streptomyces sp. NPDC087850 TaxID=3365809 RepID=UPI003811ACDE